jgi:hypothetical protein
MAHVSSGLAMALTPPTPRGELVIDPGYPYTKTFPVFNAVATSLLEFEVFTSYDSYYAIFADVRINGVSIGQIPPRGFTQFAGELATVSFLFESALFLAGGALGRTSFNNQLRIVPNPNDYLVVQNWRIHYWQISPP